ncbi:hypothetical protein COCMIDRAFT_21622 [Bipolaris oryzae ATCC 44560]|uniref:Uncharacterized protein n=1 Tax=Bipolaris oryzae ATCC 44560 TaxID=930090 RepID=W6ZGF0_COCMI|nr:uncharacterized protein COCMIDRAFT_21622 [Bipolaris oryzae ATCC 44560]EUC50907.1 hypothetical protein COCMIDRAFT_21622 [Bipolaris oryzae ATCC 44560]
MTTPRPPPAKAPSERMKSAILALQDDEEFAERAQQPTTESRLYDKDAPSTIQKRKQARDNYVMFCQVFYGETDEVAMFGTTTLIDRVCRFIEGMAKASKGILQEKAKISTLIQYRQGLEWWIKILTTSFATIKSEFMSRVTRHTHMIAQKFQLSTENRVKNNLGALEVELFFNQIMLESKRIANWKQHYVAWVLAFITGARPGSFTVSSRYRQGAPMGGAVSDSLLPRTESHTLRWSDVVFERMTEDIACSITFRFNKGYQDPYRRTYVEGRRHWFFAPKHQALHLDVSILMFLLAFERGLFVESLDDLLNGTARFIKKNSVVDKQAVFVSADKNGDLVPTKDMGYGALNPKLREMCQIVGLFEYNNMYAFRREAATVTKHTHGLANAQELLNHLPSAQNAYYLHYDHQGFGMRDTTAFRLGGPRLSEEDIRKYFSQAVSVYKPREGEKLPREELKARVEDRLIDHEEFLALEETLENILTERHQALQALGRLDAGEVYSYSPRNAANYKALMTEDAVKTQPRVADLVKKIDKHSAYRKTRRRDIRIALEKEVMEAMKMDARSRQQIIDLGAPGASAAAADDDDDDDEDLSYATMAGRDDEPDYWRAVPEGETIVVAGDEETEHDRNMRRNFINQWISHKDSDVKKSGLKYYLCRLGPTMTQAQKDKKWILAKYNTHLKSETHTRKEQLRRAFKIMQKESGDNKAACPLCDNREYTRADTFIGHVETAHSEQLFSKRTLTRTTRLASSREDGTG